MGDFLDPELQDFAPTRKWLKAGGNLVLNPLSCVG